MLRAKLVSIAKTRPKIGATVEVTASSMWGRPKPLMWGTCEVEKYPYSPTLYHGFNDWPV